MTDQWFMLTLIGEDKPGIVAAITKTLYDMGLNLGETSMLRLGGNFTIMMMVSGARDEPQLRGQLEPVVAAQKMRLHVDPIQAHLHEHLVPNIQVTVSGADCATTAPVASRTPTVTVVDPRSTPRSASMIQRPSGPMTPDPSTALPGPSSRIDALAGPSPLNAGPS